MANDDRKIVKVAGKWLNESGDVEIIHLVPIHPDEGKLNVDLFWLHGKNIPDWGYDTELSINDVQSKRSYKRIKMTSVEQDIPDDCAAALI
jgi:hypothetical protein